nr:Ldh family oxidoreductase [Zhengella mangrovi]
MTGRTPIAISEAVMGDLSEKACLACGASPAMAASLVAATLSAEQAGRHEVGLAHLLDYLQSLKDGRIDGQADPVIEKPLPAVIRADARHGIAQLGFDRAFDDLVAAAETCGIALFTQKNSYTAGEIGYYVRRLAGRGLIALAFANAHAMMAPAPGADRLYGTNPLAFAMPVEGSDPLVIDQATSATAFVTIAKAASEGRSIPEGWAVNARGMPTTDPAEAVLGALLPFGGYKGANMAIMVELLAAGLSGSLWSADARNFRSGPAAPDTGLTVIGIAAGSGDDGLGKRVAAQMQRLSAAGVHVPGPYGSSTKARPNRLLDVDSETLAAIRGFAAGVS